jgi:alpha 1,3-glucosidase
MNEPSVFNGPETTMSKDLRHLEGTVEHREVHNVYGHYMHRATFEGLLARGEGRIRPFVLTRSFYAGSQRYGAAWTGDNLACWKHLEASTPMLLSLGMAGMPFVGADVGGFFGNPDAELLLRWYQLGALQPFFRAHAHIETRRREPWLIPEPFKSGIRKAIIMRYQLLPYVYTLFRGSARGGKPVNRPLFVEFPSKVELIEVEDQFMLGNAIMVKPITKASVEKTNIVLPKDTTWYDYHTLARVDEGEVMVTQDSIPMYIKAGTIVPRKDRLRRSSDMMQKDPYTLVIGLDKRHSARGSVYADDGYSHDYQAGTYLETRLTVIDGLLSCHPVNHMDGVAVDVERIIVAGLDVAPKAVLLGSVVSAGEASLEFTFKESVLIIKTAGQGVTLNKDTWSVRLVI